MQRQRPGENNPANPLLKVVALTIDKKFTNKEMTKFKVIASLSFKKSHDMTGRTRSKDKETVFVNFTLSLKRAAFELQFENDLGVHGLEPVVIKSVAHNVKASLKAKLDETSKRSVNMEQSGALSLSGGLTAIGGLLTPKGKGSVNLKTSGGQNSSRESVIKSSTIIDGVAVTFSNSKVLWEITTKDGHRQNGDEESFIVGDVFADENGSKGEACSVVRKNSDRVVVTTGSVFIRVQDMTLGEISFSNDKGEEIGLSSLSENDVVGGFGSKARKISILKQIIRKHLIEVGMRVEGARLEVCRANV